VTVDLRASIPSTNAQGHRCCRSLLGPSPPSLPSAFVVIPKDYDPALNVLGIRVTVLASNNATLGYEITRQQGEKGMGPPPHSHDWDETFYVTKGEIEFGLGDDTSVARPGTLVHVPAGATHWFRFCEGGGEMVSLTSRLGASKLFADIDRSLPPGPPDLSILTAVANRNGVKVG